MPSYKSLYSFLTHLPWVILLLIVSYSTSYGVCFLLGSKSDCDCVCLFMRTVHALQYTFIYRIRVTVQCNLPQPDMTVNNNS
jgi:uncharacterized membrane protein